LTVSRRHEVRFLWLLILISLLAYGVIEGNVGTAYRHKMQVVPWLLMVILSVSPGRKRNLAEGCLWARDRGAALDATARMSA